MLPDAVETEYCNSVTGNSVVDEACRESAANDPGLQWMSLSCKQDCDEIGN